MEEYPHSELTHAVIGAAIEVHKALGPGLLESAYEACMEHEFGLRGLAHQRQLDVPVLYKGVRVPTAFRADFVVEGKVVVELKAVDKLIPLYDAQVLTYLKLMGLQTGLILNFNTKLLADGVKRVVLSNPPPLGS